MAVREDGAPVARVTGLRKRFGHVQAVDGVSFEIRPGETYGLLGPNGAGKTTTISTLAGLLEPDEGAVTVAGTTIRARSTRGKDAIGLVPQDLAIYPDLSGRENLAFFAALYGMPRRAARKRVDEVLEIIGLSERAGDRTSEYSGGMKRRLNIGVGLLHSPALLILDEPTVGVDPQSRNAILESVEALSVEGRAVLYTTHYMEEAERLCDRIGIMDDGRLVAEGTRRELVARLGEQDRVRIGVAGALDGVSDGLRDLDGVSEVTVDDHEVTVLAAGASARLPAIVAILAAQQVQVVSLEVTQPDLEAVFLHLTGKALRE